MPLCTSNSLNYDDWTQSDSVKEASGKNNTIEVSNGYRVDMRGDWNYKNVYKHISKYDKLFRCVGRDLDVDWRLIAAICFQESRFISDNKNGQSTAAGLWQFTEGTWQTYAPNGYKDKRYRENPEVSTRVFEILFLHNLNLHSNAYSRNDQIALAIQCHHDGSTSGTTWEKCSKLNEESYEYVPKIIDTYKSYCK